MKRKYIVVAATLLIIIIALTSIVVLQRRKKAAEIQAAQQAKIKENKKLFADYAQASKNIDEEANRRIIAADTENMPQEWRHKFIGSQLFLYHENGKWNAMLAVRDKLMNRKRASKTEFLLDVDLLLEIRGFFAGNIFFPPKEVREDDHTDAYREFATKYWEEHYKDDKEGERILQYVVDSFDNNYAPVAYAYFSLGCVQDRLGKYDQALKNLRMYEAFDLTKLYCVPTIDNSGTITPAAEILKKELGSFAYTQPFVRERIVDVVSRKSAPEAVKELRELWKKYHDDEKTRQDIEKRLRKFAEQDKIEGILPEEMGLTTNTQPTTETK